MICSLFRVLFKRMQFVYVVYDEAHMLKNMASQRYEHLMKASIRTPKEDNQNMNSQRYE